jgi:hypothetical protein
VGCDPLALKMFLPGKNGHALTSLPATPDFA